MIVSGFYPVPETGWVASASDRAKDAMTDAEGGITNKTNNFNGGGFINVYRSIDR